MHYLSDEMGDMYHISQIRDYQTGLNPYEDFLKDEPKDIVAVKENVQEETTEETAEETQDGQDEVKYSTVEEDETHEKTAEEWREEALAASKENWTKTKHGGRNKWIGWCVLPKNSGRICTLLWTALLWLKCLVQSDCRCGLMFVN